MTRFVDPRKKPAPLTTKSLDRTTPYVDDLTKLHELCRYGRLYDVERWIRSDRPLQLVAGIRVGGRRRASALEIALEGGNQALVLLLLCNGYDLNAETNCPLDFALRARRWDLFDMLLDWGADPHRVDRSDLFGTYQTPLFERFLSLGVDLTDGHELADTLAHHTSNKPLFGFARRHRQRDPAFQVELNMALGFHAEEGNEKGVALCLWAGANPHAPAPSLRWGFLYGSDDEDEDKPGIAGYSAIHEACSHGHVEILKRFCPDPSRDDFEELYYATENSAVIKYLASMAPPKNVGALIQRLLWRAVSPFGNDRWQPLYSLKTLFDLPVRWETSATEEIAAVRYDLLKAPDCTYVDVMKLLAQRDNCAPEVLKELGRTPAMRRRMKEVGFIPPAANEPERAHRRYERIRPTRSHEVVAKFGVDLPKPKREHTPLPRSVRIGHGRLGSAQVRLTRKEFFELVWTKPVSKLAEEWGMSDRGLGKACSRIKVPVPPRGYWAKVEAGQRPSRPQLPRLKSGEVDEVVVWKMP